MLYKMILLFSLMIGFSAQAMVSLESGEYSVSAVDLEISNNQLPFKLFRFYNHRARPQGIFGSKWCSNLCAVRARSTQSKGQFKSKKCVDFSVNS